MEYKEMVRDCLEVLSAEADGQIGYLVRIGGGSDTLPIDELALEFGDVWIRAAAERNAGSLTSEQFACMSELCALLDEMSGAENARIWTEEGLHASESWKRVRRSARRCLATFG